MSDPGLLIGGVSGLGNRKEAVIGPFPQRARPTAPSSEGAGPRA